MKIPYILVPDSIADLDAMMAFDNEQCSKLGEPKIFCRRAFPFEKPAEVVEKLGLDPLTENSAVVVKEYEPGLRVRLVVDMNGPPPTAPGDWELPPDFLESLNILKEEA